MAKWVSIEAVGVTKWVSIVAVGVTKWVSIEAVGVTKWVSRYSRWHDQVGTCVQWTSWRSSVAVTNG